MEAETNIAKAHPVKVSPDGIAIRPNSTEGRRPLLLRMISIDHSIVKDPGLLVTGRKYRVGRSQQCSFVVSDLSVSRIHAEVTVNEESVLVKDLGSLCGTFVEGLAIDQKELQPGQLVQFGSAQFRLLCHNFASTSFEEVAEASAIAMKNKPALPKPDRFAALHLHLLSDRQRRVLDLLLTGLSEKEIADKLCNSPHTIQNHIRVIYRRLGVKSRPELLAKLGAGEADQ